MSLNWLYRKGTEGLLTTNQPSPTIAGYPNNNLFNLNGATRFGPVQVSASVGNLFNKKPDVGGYFVADETGRLRNVRSVRRPRGPPLLVELHDELLIGSIGVRRHAPAARVAGASSGTGAMSRTNWETIHFSPDVGGEPVCSMLRSGERSSCALMK